VNFQRAYATILSLAALQAGSVSLVRAAGASGDSSSGQPAQCKIEFIKPHSAPEPHAPYPDAPAVLDTLEKMINAYARGDLSAYEKLLDDDCTAIDEKSDKMIKGKQAVLADLKDQFARHAPEGSQPLLSYTVDQPYVKVTGNMAVVVYHAVEQIGGKHPEKAEAYMTDVFVKADDKWKKVHERGQWKKLN